MTNDGENPKTEIRKPKLESRTHRRVFEFVIRISFGLRISSFGFYLVSVTTRLSNLTGSAKTGSQRSKPGQSGGSVARRRPSLFGWALGLFPSFAFDQPTSLITARISAEGSQVQKPLKGKKPLIRVAIDLERLFGRRNLKLEPARPQAHPEHREPPALGSPWMALRPRHCSWAGRWTANVSSGAQVVPETLPAASLTTNPPSSTRKSSGTLPTSACSKLLS